MAGVGTYVWMIPGNSGVACATPRRQNTLATAPQPDSNLRTVNDNISFNFQSRKKAPRAVDKRLRAQRPDNRYFRQALSTAYDHMVNPLTCATGARMAQRMACVPPSLPRLPTPTAVVLALHEPLAPRPPAYQFEPLPEVQVAEALLPLRNFMVGEPHIVDAAFCAARYADQLVITDDRRVLAYLDQAVAGAWAALPKPRQERLTVKVHNALEMLGTVCQVRHDLSQLPLRIGTLCGDPGDPLAHLRLSMLRQHVGLTEKTLCARSSGLFAVFALCLLSVSAAAVGGVFAAHDVRSEYPWLGVGLGVMGLLAGLMFVTRHDRNVATEQLRLHHDLAAAQERLAPLTGFFLNVEKRLLAKAAACLNRLETDPTGLSTAERRQAAAVRARQAALAAKHHRIIVNIEPG